MYDRSSGEHVARRPRPNTAGIALIIAALFAAGCSDMGVPPSSEGNTLPTVDVEPPLPVIASITPDTGLPGDTITVTGTDFGASSDTGAVIFGDGRGTVLAWTDTALTAVVPPLERSVPVAVQSGARTGPATPFSLTGDLSPLIVAVSPAAARVGDTIAVAGLRFGDAPGALLFHDDVTGTPPADRWGDSLITTTVPANAITGPLVVEAGSLSSARFDFTVKPQLPVPRLTRLIPARTIAGDTLMLEGDSLGGEADGRFVIFTAQNDSSVRGTVTFWTTEGVKALVPSGAASGPVGIVDGAKRSNTLPFERAPREVRWADVDALFSRNCRFSGCHGQPPAANGLSTLNGADLLAGGSVNGPVIARRRSGESFLVAVLRASTSVPGPGTVVRPMPLDLPRLSASQILMISDWIDQGSRN